MTDRAKKLTTRIAIVACLLFVPAAVDAQQSMKIPRIGYISPGVQRAFMEGLRQGLRELGYVEGRSIIIEWRFAQGSPDRLRELMADLIRLPVHVIVTDGTQVTRLAKTMTGTIPIVMTLDGDPIGSGNIASLARPGGNVTGMTTLQSGLGAKRLELLKQAVLGVSRVAVLWKPKSRTSASNFPGTEAAARALGLAVKSLEIEGPDDLEDAFRAAAEWRADAVTVLSDSAMYAHRARLLGLAARYRLPTMHTHFGWVKAGGLLSYGTDFTDLTRRAATFVDKILKGANPATMPVQQPTKFQLVVNPETARTLGIELPSSLLLRATELIE